MVTNDVRNGGSMEPRVDKREEVRTHLRKSVGVLVDERCLKDGVSSGSGVE